MKICPLCKRDFSDDLSFCLEDGSPLQHSVETADLTRRETEQFEQETVFRQGQTQSPTVRRTSWFGIILVVVLLLAGFVVLLGTGIGGYIFYTASGTQHDLPVEPSSTQKPVGKSTINNTEPDLPTVNHNMNTANRQTTPADLKVVDPNTEPGNRPANTAPPPPPRMISGGVLNGKAVSLPKPDYPPAARAVRAGGPVTVQVTIDEQGNVVSASPVSGHPLLRAAAAAAARNAKFSPTLLSGTPVRVTGVIIYRMGPNQPAKIDREDRREIRKGERP